MKRLIRNSAFALAVVLCALAVRAGATSDGPQVEPASTPSQAVAAALTLPWLSFNGGGGLGNSSASYELNYSLGQSVTGRSVSTSYVMGIGFWYGTGACPIAMTGDVNVSGTITSADIIGLVNYVFKGGLPPQPCAASGDVNCSGAVTSADIIGLVNYVFKGGLPPCDACTSPLAAGC